MLNGDKRGRQWVIMLVIRLPDAASGLVGYFTVGRLIKSIDRTLKLFAVYPARTARAIKNLPTYCANYRSFTKKYSEGQMQFEMGRKFPQLFDRTQKSGTAKGHYFHQDLLVASRIFRKNPILHADVGSRIDGFVAHVASFRKIEVFDIREMESKTANIVFRQLDLMEPPSPEFQDYCDSLSCLHALEHFGLGRYGDKIDPNGYLTGLDHLTLMLQTEGTLYLSVPIGPQRIEFDAHRVFSVGYLLGLLESRGMRIDRFSYVDDKGDLHEDVALTPNDIERSFGCYYGCGIVEATKSTQ